MYKIPVLDGRPSPNQMLLLFSDTPLLSDAGKSNPHLILAGRAAILLDRNAPRDLRRRAAVDVLRVLGSRRDALRRLLLLHRCKPDPFDKVARAVLDDRDPDPLDHASVEFACCVIAAASLHLGYDRGVLGELSDLRRLPLAERRRMARRLGDPKLSAAVLGVSGADLSPADVYTVLERQGVKLPTLRTVRYRLASVLAGVPMAVNADGEIAPTVANPVATIFFSRTVGGKHFYRLDLHRSFTK